MIPKRRRVFGSAVVVALLIAIPLMTIPRGAFAADVDEEPGAKSGSKTDITDQAEDKDRPKDPSLLDKNAADAAVAQKKQQEGPPFYEKWQFWAIAGGVVAAIVVAAIVAPKISHQVNGGDVRPCNTMFVTCVGAGR
jgi:hypothetical protein